MGASCCGHDHHHHADSAQMDARYRRVLWTVLALNAAMFAVEIGAGVAAGSASLQADALDFFGDAANYGISLFVIGMALRMRAFAALGKGISMGLFGLWVLGTVVWHLAHGTLPDAATMGAVGFAALAVNAASFALLWAYRGGDANMRSATSRCSPPRSACSAPARVGRTSSSRPSWRAWRCRARGPSFANRSASFAGRCPFPPSRFYRRRGTGRNSPLARSSTESAPVATPK
jgi:hypothetical protein